MSVSASSPRDALTSLVDELHATLGRLALALGLARDAFVWTDRHGSIVWCNAAFDRLVRADHVALLGEPLADRLVLERKGRAVTGGAHPARRLLAEVDALTETYEMTAAGRPSVVELVGCRGVIDDEPASVIVIEDITERARVQTELQALNAQLEATNNELEAFSYSVSHDLRTPLRAIDGFSQALVEDYADLLDDRGKKYLERLRIAAQNMGRLIEDMLRLSRVTRAEFAWTDVDLSALAGEIASEVAASAPNQDVELAIADDLAVRGDRSMLRQVLWNLIDNAWKFTSKTPHARIEIGARADGEGSVFFVRDNGAGFDMGRADKLFGAFQRLHTAEEFPGIGIGLAIARRIVHRHGGRIWAEGEPGKGATFSFTIPRTASGLGPSAATRSTGGHTRQAATP